jgi:hypothetical protein
MVQRSQSGLSVRGRGGGSSCGGGGVSQGGGRRAMVERRVGTTGWMVVSRVVVQCAKVR